jgi:hypothetical protein
MGGTVKTYRLGIVAAFAFAVLGAWGVHSQPKTSDSDLTAALRDHVRAERFAPVATVAALPAGVRDELNNLFGDKALELADPGMPFQATDLVRTPRLPWRRMVAAGCSADHCLVYYERGGYAHVYYAALFKVSTAGTRFEFGGPAAGGLPDLEAVKDALVAGEVAGQPTSKHW